MANGSLESKNTADDGAAMAEQALYCFDVIDAKLNHSKRPIPAFDERAEFPLFVTWSIQSRSDGQKRLRGCIGNFEPMPLGEGLRDYAEISAFKDSRFDPISSKELPRLSCGVSLLTDFELCENILDWDIEYHGIYIQFPNPLLTPQGQSAITNGYHEPNPYGENERKIYRSISCLPPFTPPRCLNPRRLQTVLTATYLPDVAKEQGWTKLEALDSAIRKAGYTAGKITDHIRDSCRVTKYQSQKVEKTYDDWRRARS